MLLTVTLLSYTGGRPVWLAGHGFHSKLISSSGLVLYNLFLYLVAGTAADIAKNAVITTQGRLEARGLEARVVLLVHDEIVWEVKAGDILNHTADFLV